MGSRLIFLILLCISAASTPLATVVAAPTPTDSTFTYQGRLLDGRQPARGNYDLEFSLWDAETAGIQVGSTLSFNGVPVSDGLLTVQLDFGAEAFDNNNRWLQIIVNGTTLSPRQPITRVPYAIQTRGLFVTDDSFVGIGTHDPIERLHVNGSLWLDAGDIIAFDSRIHVRAAEINRGAICLESDGDIDMNGRLCADGDIDAGGDLLADGLLDIGGDARIDGDLCVFDNVGIGRCHDNLFQLIQLVVDDDGLNWAAWFIGDVRVEGTLTKNGGSFQIDHPLDPKNKCLSHSFVESPDMMNVYNGNVVTDADGIATVNLPDYFQALNRDFRYQLTVIGEFAQAIVAEEIANNRFIIRTNKPNVKVSWQVTGIRQDAWAEANRIQVEQWKEPENRGSYLNPDVFRSRESDLLTTDLRGES